MPNWVFNGLTIEGNPDSVNKLIEQMNKPFVNSIVSNGDLAYGIKETKYINPIFSFRNIIAPTDLEAYKKQPWTFDMENRVENPDSWYNWNIRNWGVKWDVAVSEDEKYPDTYMEEHDNGENKVVYYNFNTAWSRPLMAILKLSEQYPNLLFSLSYEEETGWGGEMEFLRGTVISESEYDNKCRDCDATNSLEYCEEECGEICNVCHWLGEADLDAVAECQTHKIYLDESHLPVYRKAE
jgi:hypothetical protein